MAVVGLFILFAAQWPVYEYTGVMWGLVVTWLLGLYIGLLFIAGAVHSEREELKYGSNRNNDIGEH